MKVLTRFTHGVDGPAPSSKPGEQVKSKQHGGETYPHAVGKVTHPCGAPDNHLLTVWSPRAGQSPVQLSPRSSTPASISSRTAKPIDEPGQMLLIKHDPKYNEQWPRPLVPYQRIYGVEEPARLIHKNDGKLSPHLPEGTPFGLVGTSSMYKRESYRRAAMLPEGSVTAVPADPRTPSHCNWRPGKRAPTPASTTTATFTPSASCPWSRAPTSAATARVRPCFGNHAMERLRILGEIPVRKFDGEKATHRSRRQPRHQLPGQDPGRRHLHIPDAGQGRHGAEHGADVASVAAGRNPHRLRRLPRPQPEADAVREDGGRTPRLQGLGPDGNDAAPHRKADDQSGKKWDKDGETGLRFRKGVQERGILPRRPADLRTKLRRLPFASDGQAGRRPGAR